MDREGVLSKVSLRQIFRKIIARLRALCFLSAHAPQCGLNDAVKGLYYDQLYPGTTSEFLIPCGDWNGHVECTGSGYGSVYRGCGYDNSDHDIEIEWILKYLLAYKLLLGNTCFKKRDSHLIKYRSGYTATVIDFLLFRKSLCKLVTVLKAIPAEEVALQHQLVCT